MRHFTSPSFRECYANLPSSIQELADKNYNLLKANPNRPSLHLKKVGRYWSVRIGRKHRALAVQIEEGLLRFWIGMHAEYDRLIG
jgi:hypothetical protein